MDFYQNQVGPNGLPVTAPMLYQLLDLIILPVLQ